MASSLQPPAGTRESAGPGLTSPAEGPQRSVSRSALAEAIGRACAIHAQIASFEEGLGRCDAIIAAVAPARGALEDLEKADHEKVRQWAVAGARGVPPARDEERIRAAASAWEKAKAEGDAAARAREAILAALRPHLVARDQEGAAVAALVRRVVCEEADGLVTAMRDLELRRAKLRAEVAGLMFHLQMEGARGGTSATKLANDLRNKLAVDPVETTDAEAKRAASAWLDFAVRLRSDADARFASTIQPKGN
jgi:hypothetical protein